MKKTLLNLIALFCAFFTISCSSENDDTIQQDSIDNLYQVKILTWADNITYYHNVKGFTGTIDWGDGTTDTYTEPVDYPKHIYQSTDEYTVDSKGIMEGINSEGTRTRIITEICHIGKDLQLKTMQYAFFKQFKLKEIPSGILDNCSHINDFSWIFSAGTDENFQTMNFPEIPVGLFDKCTEATTFERAFYSCHALKSIPEGLFDNNTKVTNFNCTFGGCKNITAIPEGLFDNCPNVTDFGECFMGWAAATVIPEGLFDNNPLVTNFWNVFGWGSFESIPEGLFDNNPLVESFSCAFRNCNRITSIPENLFANCPEVKDFSQVFAGPYDSDFEYMSITNIPAGLFDNNRKVTNFSEAFKCCNAASGESPYTIIQVDGVDTKVHLYERYKYPEYFATPEETSRCFFSCTELEDYPILPTEWL